VKRASLFVSLALSCAAAAQALPDRCVSAIRRALGSGASWRMERRLEGSERTLVSTGVVSCVLSQGIEWKVLHPFPSSVCMTTNSMVFADEEGRRVKPLSDLPYYEEIRERTDAFARGDVKAFDGLFETESEELADGGWRIVFTPQMRAMRRLFTEMEISGRDTMDKAVLKTENGGVSDIRFRESRRGR
jgi:hypothetical protein